MSIKNWKELSKVPDSETHTLEIEDYCGWIIEKRQVNEVIYQHIHFTAMSTKTAQDDYRLADLM